MAEGQAMATPTGQLSIEQIISAVSHLSLSELRHILDHILALQAERKAAHLPERESVLLIRINQGLPCDLRTRLTLLRDKREDGTITDAEYEELTQLTDRAEEVHADRMAALVELATLRGVSLPVLLEQLGIHFPEHV
jgi:hypothetical protein